MSVSIEHMPNGHTRLVVDGAVVWDDKDIDGHELTACIKKLASERDALKKELRISRAKVIDYEDWSYRENAVWSAVYAAYWLRETKKAINNDGLDAAVRYSCASAACDVADEAVRQMRRVRDTRY
jgi:hypothetical protein